MNVTLRQLRVLVAVAEKGSFSAAASAIGLTQPAVSQCLRALENELQVRLIQRTTRHVCLTAVGAALLTPLKRKLADIETLLAQAQRSGREQQDLVRVACTSSVPGRWLAKSLAEASRRHPAVEVVVQDMPLQEALDALRSGLADCVLAVVDGTAKNLLVEPLFEDAYVLVCRRDHPFGRRRQVHAQQLALEHLIVLEAGSQARRALADVLAAPGGPRLDMREVAQATTALGLVAEGLGVALLPATCLPLPARSALRAVAVAGMPVRQMALVMRKTPALTPAAQSLRQVFIEQTPGAARPPVAARPITLLIPFPEGGPADSYGRAFARALSATLHQEVFIRNVSGLGGAQGVHAVTRSAADGFTIGLAGNGATVFSPSAHHMTLFNVFDDLTFLSGLVRVPTILVAGAHLPVRTLEELIAQARLAPGRLTIGMAGTGSSRVLAQLMQSEAGLRLNCTAFDGLVPAIKELARARIDLLFGEPAGVMALIRDGTARALMTAGDHRAPGLAEVPCAAEVGLPGVATDGGYCLVAPGSLPKDIAMRLSGAISEVLHSPQIARSFEALGVLPDLRIGPRYSDFVKAEQSRWRSFNTRISKQDRGL